MNPEEFALAPKDGNPKDVIGSDKLPLDLIPGTTKAYLALGHFEGAVKYGICNFREVGVRTSIYLAALERHIEKFKAGEWEDPVTTVPHLANALACISIIIDSVYAGKLEDDRAMPGTGVVPNALPPAMGVPQLIDSFSEKVKYLKKLFKEANPTDYFIGGQKKRA